MPASLYMVQYSYKPPKLGFAKKRNKGFQMIPTELKPIEYYLERRLIALEDKGDTARAGFDRAVFKRAGSHNLVAWCKGGPQFSGFTTVADAFHLHGFETTDERVSFFMDNHGIIKPYFNRAANKERRQISSSILAKGLDRYISSAPTWPDVFDTLNDADINDIFLSNNTRNDKYTWMIDNFMGWWLLNMRFDIKWCVVDSYMKLTEADD